MCENIAVTHNQSCESPNQNFFRGLEYLEQGQNYEKEVEMETTCSEEGTLAAYQHSLVPAAGQ